MSPKPMPTAPARNLILRGIITLGGVNRHCYLSAEYGWTMTADNVAKLLGITKEALYDLRRQRTADLFMDEHLTKMYLTKFGARQIVWTRAGVRTLARLIDTPKARAVEADVGCAVVTDRAQCQALEFGPGELAARREADQLSWKAIAREHAAMPPARRCEFLSRVQKLLHEYQRRVGRVTLQ